MIIAIIIIGTGLFFIINQIKEFYSSQNSYPNVSTVDIPANDSNSSNIKTRSINSNKNNRKPPVDNRHEIINGYTYSLMDMLLHIRLELHNGRS